MRGHPARPPTSSSSSSLKAPSSNAGAVAAARALRLVFVQKWKLERHALLFKPLNVEIGAEVQQWDRPRGKSVAPLYRVVKLNVGLDGLQARTYVVLMRICFLGGYLRVGSG